MVVALSSVSLLSSMKSKNVDIPAVIKFIFQIIYNRPKQKSRRAKLVTKCCYKKKETKINFRLLNPFLPIKVLSK